MSFLFLLHVLSSAKAEETTFRSEPVLRTEFRRGKAPIGYTRPDYSLGLRPLEIAKSEDDYWHRTVINTIALGFASLMSLAGFWLVNVIAHSLRSEKRGEKKEGKNRMGTRILLGEEVLGQIFLLGEDVTSSSKRKFRRCGVQ